MEQTDVPEPGGTDDFNSASATPLPVVGRRIPRKLRAVSAATHASQESQADGVELNDTSTVSSESSDSDISSRDGSEAPVANNRTPTPTAVRTTARN